VSALGTVLIAAAPSIGRRQCYRPAVGAAVTDITEFAVSSCAPASSWREQIGQMLNPAFANRLLAAAEEPPTAQ
jgi:hypothetical protein